MSQEMRFCQLVDGWVDICTLDRRFNRKTLTQDIINYRRNNTSYKAALNALSADIADHDYAKANKVIEILSGGVYIDLLLDVLPGDYERIKTAHKIIYDNVYERAGQERSGLNSQQFSHFCLPNTIAENMKTLQRELSDDNYLAAVKSNKLAKRCAYYFNFFNMIHPFERGNGVMNRLFITASLSKLGKLMDWSEINYDDYTEACQSGFHGDLAELEQLFKHSIH